MSSALAESADAQRRQGNHLAALHLYAGAASECEEAAERESEPGEKAALFLEAEAHMRMVATCAERQADAYSRRADSVGVG